MPPSVRTVTDLPGLGLRRLAGPDGRDRPVRWVAVSELEDPTPFLEGGELLLSTGMRLPADRPKMLAAYVDRLVDAGVAAFGLGVGLTHEQCPPALVREADARGLPLLEVPAPTAFIAVSKAVSALLGAEEYDAITQAFEAQRDLTRAALAPEGPGAVAARLARHVGGWVLVLDGQGAVLHAAPSAAAARAPDLAAGLSAELATLRGRGLLASSSVADADGRVSLHPLGARGRVRGFLAVGTPQPLDRHAQSVVAVAVSLLSIAVEQDGPADVVRGVVRAAALRLLVAGGRPEELPLAPLGLRWLTGAPLRVLAVAGSGREREAAATALAALDAAGGPERGVADDGEVLLVVVPDESAVLDAVVAALAGRRTGVSAPAPVQELGRARSEAVRALAAVRVPGVGWYGQLASQGMLAALDPEAALSIADSLLAPLEGRKGDLVGSLAAWLGRHGQWDTAAADLGVHRHTLRYRIRRVEELLGRSLDDVDLRAELWLALRVRSMTASDSR
ncbi:MAG: PucR family transcriptional regulator [Kineosporiaceae bacterium]